MTPFLNSSYDASFIAGMIQYRYIYSLPVERIIKMFNENGFDLDKATAHGLIAKAAKLLQPLDEVLRGAIHADPYLIMDETYQNILVKKQDNGKGIFKGYVWGVIADRSRLIHFFYKNGSRAKAVLQGYLDKDYRGTVHTDGYVCYNELETDSYPYVTRIACWQHGKRRFLDSDLPDAQKMVDLINELYRIEHQMDPQWDVSRKLKYRQQKGGIVIRKIEKLNARIQGNQKVVPKSPLYDAAEYLHNELPYLKNYLLDYQYALDTNTIERYHRYISISRRNSLFCGSHQGAERMALLYSLACSCRLNDVNTLDYFTDLLNRMATMPPNASQEVLRELLPDRWKKQAMII